MSLSANYLGQTTRQLSGKIWGKMDVPTLQSNPHCGRFEMRDFYRAEALATTVSNGGLFAFLDTSATAAPVATDDDRGRMILSTATTDNNAAGLTDGDNVLAPWRIDVTKQNDVAFECSFTLSSIVDVAILVGLGEEGLAANDTLADNTGAIADKDFVGFRTLTAAPTELDAFFKEEGQTEVEVAAAAGTIVAGTAIKAGFYYDASKDTIKYYVDNVLVGTQTGVTDVNFPTGEGLAPLVYIKTGSAADKEISIDWWAIAQQYDD